MPDASFITVLRSVNARTMQPCDGVHPTNATAREPPPRMMRRSGLNTPNTERGNTYQPGLGDQLFVPLVQLGPLVGPLHQPADPQPVSASNPR
eukprot:COSAG01_NODE_39_length_33243_cov_28.298558_21_plen_93_part_00